MQSIQKCTYPSPRKSLHAPVISPSHFSLLPPPHPISHLHAQATSNLLSATKFVFSGILYPWNHTALRYLCVHIQIYMASWVQHHYDSYMLFHVSVVARGGIQGKWLLVDPWTWPWQWKALHTPFPCPWNVRSSCLPSTGSCLKETALR